MIFVVFLAAHAKHKAKISTRRPEKISENSSRRSSQTPAIPSTAVVAPIESGPVLNHLFVGRQEAHKLKNRTVVTAPRIAPLFPSSAMIGPQLAPQPISKQQRNLHKMAPQTAPAIQIEDSKAMDDRTSSSSHKQEEEREEREAKSTETSGSLLAPQPLTHSVSDTNLKTDFSPNSSPSSPDIPRSHSVPMIREDNPQHNVLNMVPASDRQVTKDAENMARLAIQTHKLRNAKVKHVVDVENKMAAVDNGNNTPKPAIQPLLNKNCLTQRRLQQGIKLGLYKPDALQQDSKKRINSFR